MTVVRIDEIEQVQYRFTELGRTLSDLSEQQGTYFDDTVKSLSKGFDEVNELCGDDRLTTASTASGVLLAKTADLSIVFEKVIKSVSNSFDQVMTGVGESATRLGTISSQFEDMAKGKPSELPVGEDEKKKDADKKKTKKPNILQKEYMSLKSKVSGMMGQMKVPKVGAILGSAVGLMAYGFIYEDRLKSEAGEIKNSLESAFDFGIKNIRDKGTQAFSALQENLQKYGGIAKEEVQSTVRTLTQGGVGISEMLDRVGEDFGRVGKSAVHSTLALDKMFELPGGTTAQTAINYMHNYGMSLSEAGEMTRDLYLNDQAFKIGVPTFVQNIESAADSVKDLGFSIRGVMDVAGSLQESFESIGVPRQFAGKLAGMGVREMAQGISNLSEDWKVLMGQRMFKGSTGLDALQRFEESFTRVKEGNSVEEYKDLILEMYKTAQGVSQGDESQMYAFLSRNMGLGSYGARAVMEVGKTMQQEGGVAAVKATEKHMSTFKDAFQTESSKASQFRREMNKWMLGMSQIGRGLLGIVGKTLAYLITLFRAWPEMFSAMVSGDTERMLRINAKVQNMVPQWSKDVDMMKKGLGSLKGAGKELFGDVFASSIDSLGEAFTGDFSGELRPRDAERPESFREEDRMPVLQTVHVPVSAAPSDTTYEARMAPGAESAARRFMESKGMRWFGGGLSLVSGGVDEHGNMRLDIVGNCPRCGLIFGGGKHGMRGTVVQPPAAAKGGAYTSMGLAGEGKFSSEDVEAAGRVLSTEMGGYSTARHNEAVGILQSLMNRGGRKGGGALYKKATGGQGWGKQAHGSKRQYASRRKFKKGGATEQFVRKFMRGDVDVPEKLKNVRGFFHARKGDVFRGPTGYKGAVPKFASKGGITAVEESKPGKKAFFYTPKAADTPEGKAGRRWLKKKSKPTSVFDTGESLNDYIVPVLTADEEEE